MAVTDNNTIKSVIDRLNQELCNLSLVARISIVIADRDANLIKFIPADTKTDNILKNHIDKSFVMKHINKLFKHKTNTYTSAGKTFSKLVTDIESYEEVKGYIILISENKERMEITAPIIKKLLEQSFESIFKDFEIKQIVTEIVEKHERLTLYSSLSNEIAKIHDLNPLVEKIGEHISKSFEFDTFLVLLRSDNTTDLYVSKRIGKMIDPFLENVLKIDLAQRVKQTGKSQIIYEDSGPHMPPSILCTPIQLDKSYFGMLVLIKEKENQPYTNEERDHLEMFSMETAKGIHRILLYSTLKKKYFTTIASLAEAIDAKDPYTKGHSSRVAMYSVETARKMGLSGESIETIQTAGYLHDVGKIGIAESILRKETPLNDEELQIMQAHPLIAAKILQPISFLGDISTIALQHHEKCDGSGYPNGLTKNNILLESRIIALCDAFDAMSGDRPYRKAFPLRKCFMILKNDSGRHFDEDVVIAFYKAWVDHLENNIFPFIRLVKKQEMATYIKDLIATF